jgi:hypothetical protein
MVSGMGYPKNGMRMVNCSLKDITRIISSMDYTKYGMRMVNCIGQIFPRLKNSRPIITAQLTLLVNPSDNQPSLRWGLLIFGRNNELNQWKAFGILFGDKL